MALTTYLTKVISSWTKWSSFPLGIAGLLYLGTYAGSVVFKPGSTLQTISELGSNVIWSLFFLDFLIKLFGIKKFGQFIGETWFDIICLLIPFFRFLRAFRVIFAIRSLGAFFQSRMHKTGAYVGALVPIIWFGSAVAVLDAERGQLGTSITGLPEAMWWSISTMTTIGFGDFPQSLEGRFIAVALMLSGIGLFSAAAGMFANWIISDPAKAKKV
ncbi:unannotated protein [freshwater metagenome]|uniref:Unannotated protein n=1 Tax=freshwater metagenome TaxID=449393 RepID=A0A6J6IRK2_9ZZZZ